MGTSIATARAALDILRASATVCMSPAHITGIRSVLGSMRGTGEEDETLRVLHALRTGGRAGRTPSSSGDAGIQ